MRKKAILATGTALALSTLGWAQVPALASAPSTGNPLTVQVNHLPVSIPNYVSATGRDLVSLAQWADAINARWSVQGTQQASLQYAGTVITFTANSTQADVNGSPATLLAPAVVSKSGNWYVPVRSVANLLDLTLTVAGSTVQVNTGLPHVSWTGGLRPFVFAQGTGTLTNPDDIAMLNGNIFVAFQNGVHAKGQPSASGINYSTVVEFTPSGKKVASWNLTGHCDGLAADTANNRLLATVNEDANSSMYVIHPDATSNAIQHLTYNVDPATISPSNPLASGGGTDSIAIENGHIFISASNPSPDTSGNFTHAAVFQATISGSTATLTPVLMGNAQATDISTGSSVTLNLSDPDASTIVPSVAPHYAGDLVLDSQGDAQLMFVQQPGTPSQKVSRLSLGTQIDDAKWITAPSGQLFIADNQANAIFAIAGQFTPGTVYAAAAHDSPVAGFVGTLDLNTGTLHPTGTGFLSPQGMLFVPGNS